MDNKEYTPISQLLELKVKCSATGYELHTGSVLSQYRTGLVITGSEQSVNVCWQMTQGEI